MRLPVGGVALPGLGAREVDRAAQPAAALSARLGAELLREREQRRVSKRVLGDRVSLQPSLCVGLAEQPGDDALEREDREESDDVGECLVEGGLVGEPWLGEARPQPVQHRVCRLVCDDVVRETGLELGATIQREIAEEDGAVLGRVVGVQLREGSRDQKQLVAAEGPRHPPPETFLEGREGASRDRVDVLGPEGVRSRPRAARLRRGRRRR